ncbi:hypothetical protein GCM10009409_05770 [Shewanella saliphila]|uniref:Uncharacterized protein n=1 Tax=Shewanella saliphila TaxID=2282698 RepID=A0ABQ2Q3X9_9GAMM|nr:hypothetical protein GCM10009409_05770 [Shewanella saliphila]
MPKSLYTQSTKNSAKSQNYSQAIYRVEVYSLLSLINLRLVSLCHLHFASFFMLSHFAFTG